MIVLMPITIPMSHALWGDSETASWAPIYPAVHCRNFGTVLVGGIPWLPFGWWGVPKSEPKAVVNTKARWPMGTYVETPAVSMVVGDPSSKTGEFNKEK